MEILTLFSVVGATVSAVTAAARAPGRPLSGQALHIMFNPTAVAGTAPTIDVTVEGSLDGVTWTDVCRWGVTTDTTSKGTHKLTLGGNADLASATIPVYNTSALGGNAHRNVFFPQLRLDYTIGGATPSWTFEVSAWWV